MPVAGIELHEAVASRDRGNRFVVREIAVSEVELRLLAVRPEEIALRTLPSPGWIGGRAVGAGARSRRPRRDAWQALASAAGIAAAP
jgi:hypothetical protein